MTMSVLELPTDIPWERLCVTEDMMDREICERREPPRWRSSVAVFWYEPPSEHQTYEELAVGYLKVVCSITGFQPDPHEVGLPHRRVDSYWNDPGLIADYKQLVARSYPCLGALLEVAVAPSSFGHPGDTIALSDYPYFADFEPKKRELYELVSDTGEVMSRSLEDLSVAKGLATTRTSEVTDSMSVGVKVGSSAGILSYGVSGEGKTGTRHMTQDEFTNLRTTDQGREVRETLSHTTQLTQMYHQLTSYHLGTNRAVFLFQPRPHIVQSPLTFINGPRQLEGIQEIFLVVMRPKEQGRPCVEAHLETAHVIDNPLAPRETRSVPVQFNVGPNLGSFNIEDGAGWQVAVVRNPPEGWEFDLAHDGGYAVAGTTSPPLPSDVNLSVDVGVSPISATSATLHGRIEALLLDEVPSDASSKLAWEIAQSNADDNARALAALRGTTLVVSATLYLRRSEPPATLILTGHGTCCCPALKIAKPGWVAWEGRFSNRDFRLERDDSSMAVATANLMRDDIGRAMVASVNSTERYADGAVRFAESQVVARRLARALGRPGHPDDQPVDVIVGLSPTLAEKVAAAAQAITRRRLLQMSPAEQRDRFGLDDREVQLLRRALAGIEGPEADPRTRWDEQERRLVVRARLLHVPQLVGLPVAEALDRLRDAGFESGARIRFHRDAQGDVDSVAATDPPGGAELNSSSIIDLWVVAPRSSNESPT